MLNAMNNTDQRRPLSDTEVAALTALVTYDTAVVNGEVQKYGQFMHNPQSAAVDALYQELRRRGVVEHEEA